MITKRTFIEAQPVRYSRAERRARAEQGLAPETTDVEVTEWSVSGPVQEFREVRSYGIVEDTQLIVDGETVSLGKFGWGEIVRLFERPENLRPVDERDIVGTQVTVTTRTEPGETITRATITVG